MIGTESLAGLLSARFRLPVMELVESLLEAREFGSCGFPNAKGFDDVMLGMACGKTGWVGGVADLKFGGGIGDMDLNGPVALLLVLEINGEDDFAPSVAVDVMLAGLWG